MLAYVFRRLLQVVPLVLGILILTFFLVHLAPGDPIYALAGQSGDAAYGRTSGCRAPHGAAGPHVGRAAVDAGDASHAVRLARSADGRLRAHRLGQSYRPEALLAAVYELTSDGRDLLESWAMTLDLNRAILGRFLDRYGQLDMGPPPEPRSGTRVIMGNGRGGQSA